MNRVVDPGSSGRTTIAWVFAAACVIVLPFSATAAMGIQIRADIGFDETAFGLLLSIFSIGGLVGGPVGGAMIQRIGPSAGLRLAVGMAAIGSVAMACSTSWWNLAAVMVLCGAAAGMADPATNTWISVAVPPVRHGTAIGIKQASSQLAAVLSGLLVPTIVLTAGWRWAVGLIALAGAVLAPIVPAASGAVKAQSRRQPGRLDHLGPLTWLVAAACLGFGGSATLQIFFVSSVVESGGSEAVAGVLMAVGSVSAVSARLTLGLLIDRSSRSRLRLVAALLLGGGLSCLLLAFASPIAIVLATPAMFATSLGWSGLLQLAVLQAFPGSMAKATGVVMGGAFGGVVLGPFAFGALADRSYAVAWSALAAVFLAGALATMTSRRTFRTSLGMANASPATVRISERP